MKLVATSILAAVIACTGLSTGPITTARGDSPQLPEKKAEKRVANEDVKQLLEAMGYQPQPLLSKDSKLIGYSIRFESDEFSLYAEISISGNGKFLWVGGPYGKDVDETAASYGLLKMLELNDIIWPAYVTYMPKNKQLYVLCSTPAANLSAATLRSTVDTYSRSMKAVIKTWDNGQALAGRKD